MDASLDDLAPKTLKSRMRALLRLCLRLVGIFALAAALSILAAGAIVLIDPTLSPLAPSEPPGGERDENAAVLWGLIASYLAYLSVGAAVFLAARFYGGGNWRALIAWRPWSPRKTSRRVWLLAGGAIAYSLSADFAFNFFDNEMEPWVTMPTQPLAAAALAILATILAPIVEEIVFRGWIFTDLRRNFSFWPALLATSIVFAGLHYESTHLYALAVLPLGLALGAIRELTGSVKASIALHACNNFIACCLSFLDAAGLTSF